MICQKCGHRTATTDSRMVYEGNVMRRRRICPQCGERYTTYEVWGSSPAGESVKQYLSQKGFA